MNIAHLRKKSLFVTAFFFVAFLSKAVSQTMTCHDIRNGVFVYFSYKDGTKSTYTRNGPVQKEMNAPTHETVLWDVEWANDCSYFLKYNSGLEDRPKQELDFLKKHKFLYQILSVTDDYYIFESHVDNPSNPVVIKDTLWIKQWRDARNKSISNPRIDSLLPIRKIWFDSAMSKTATLYLYRPGKFAEGGVDCIIYMNNTPVCNMSNKAAYIVRLLKEGPTTLVGKVRNQETMMTINVEFGKKYFLRCDIPRRLAPKALLTMGTEEEAKNYFDRVK